MTRVAGCLPALTNKHRKASYRADKRLKKSRSLTINSKIMNYQEKAEKYLAFFEQKEKGEDTITILKNTAPAELQESVNNAHGERLPNDWIFDKYESILFNITEYEDRQDINDIRAEIVDGLVSVYTSDLTSWLNDSNYNVYYLTEALENYEPKDGFQALAMAQYHAIDEIFSEVVNLLEKEDTDNE